MKRAGAAQAEVEVTPSERAEFVQRGFVVIDRPILRDADLDDVAAIMEQLMARRAEIAPELIHDLGAGDSASRVDEIVWPSRLYPQLKRSAVFFAARGIAAALLDAPVSLHFDHLIDKPPRSQGVTQWHQDRAFEQQDGRKVTVWVPLVDVDETNGCMQYVAAPGELLAHERAGQNGLRAIDLDTSARTVAPIRRRGLCAHRELTPHATGPNQSGAHRAAWVVRFREDRDSSLRRVVSEIAHGTSSLAPFHRITRIAEAQRHYG